MSPPVRSVGFVLGVLAALLTGYYFGRRSTATEVASLKNRVADQEQKVTTTGAEIDRLRQQAAQTQRASMRVSAEHLATSPDRSVTAADRLRILAQLQNEKIIGVGMNIIDRDGKVAESFAKLVDLSVSEKAALQRTVDETRQGIDQMILANVSTRQEADTFIIKVKPFENGANLYDSLMDGFQRVLGPDRYASFIALAGKGIGTYFDEFGAQERTVTFWRETIENGHPVVYAQDNRKTPTSNGGASGPRDLDNLNAQYQWMKIFAPQVTELPPRPKSSPRP